jgi:hypothetical protein
MTTLRKIYLIASIVSAVVALMRQQRSDDKRKYARKSRRLRA